MTLPTATFLDLEQWPRRAAFEFFRGFDIPCFNLCTRLDVSRLRRAVKEAGVGSMSLAYHFIAIRLANDIAPFRYRLQGDRVRVHELVHGSTTVLREDDSFGFATLEHQRDFAKFSLQGASAIASARQCGTPFEPNKDETATVHMTTLPCCTSAATRTHVRGGCTTRYPRLRSVASMPRVSACGCRFRWRCTTR